MAKTGAVGRNPRDPSLLAQLILDKLANLPIPERTLATTELLSDGISVSSSVRMGSIPRVTLERGLEKLMARFDVGALGSSPTRQPVPFTGEVAALAVDTELTFTLTPVPATAGCVRFYVHGVLQSQDTDYSVDITTGKITWLGTSSDHDIEADDELIVLYEV